MTRKRTKRASASGPMNPDVLPVAHVSWPSGSCSTSDSVGSESSSLSFSLSESPVDEEYTRFYRKRKQGTRPCERKELRGEAEKDDQRGGAAWKRLL
jgi:hypothetical protein